MASKFTKLMRSILGSRGPETPHEEMAEAVDYKGYKIRPTSRQEGSQWRTAGLIFKDFPDAVKEQAFIRADMHASKDDADACSILKAKRIIDEQGDGLFRDS